jgi:predicted transcriptional regulator
MKHQIPSLENRISTVIILTSGYYNTVIYLSASPKKYIMKLYCEIAAKELLPAIRSIMARELLTTYKLKQTEAAKLMFLTQPAISNYGKQSRGKKVAALEKNKEIMGMIDDLTKKIVNWEIKEKQICIEICKIINRIKETEIPHALSDEEVLDCSGV